MANFHNRGNSYRGGNFNRNNFGGQKGGNDFEKDNVFVQEDTIFVSQMNPDVTETEISDHFGSIGIIKKDKRTQKLKIWIYKDKETGNGKGECTITYDDPFTASSAIEWFDGKEFNGSTIKVQLAQRNAGNSSWQKGAGGGGGGGGVKKPSGGGNDNTYGSYSQPKSESKNSNTNANHREGDWNCAECSNKNFAWRNECNRCKAPKSNAPTPRSDTGRSFDRGGKGYQPSAGNHRHRPY